MGMPVLRAPHEASSESGAQTHEENYTAKGQVDVSRYSGGTR